MSFVVRVGDVAMKIVCDERTIPSTPAGPARLFLVDDDQADSTMTVRSAPGLTAPRGKQLFDSGLVWQLHRDRDDFVFGFHSPVFGNAPYRLARFNSAFTAGRVSIGHAPLAADVPVKPFDYPLDELLMINLLARGRGVEIHACGVVDHDGAAYVFAGQSGAGKSTIARLWHADGATILSDDRLILRVRDGHAWVYGTPWHGEERFACPRSAPLSAIYFLAHASRNSATSMSAASAAARLFACSFPPFYDQAGIEFTLALLADIMRRVPAFELKFVPDPQVTRFVRAA